MAKVKIDEDDIDSAASSNNEESDNEVDVEPLNDSAESKDTEARVVECRIKILSVGEVDTMRERFDAEVRVQSKWIETEEIKEYDKKVNWNPKLFIQNALHNVKENVTYTVAKLNNKTQITETRIAKGSFWERIELQDFPMDIQEISITLASKRKSSEVRIVASAKPSCQHAEVRNTFRDQQKWRLYSIVDTSEKASYDTVKEMLPMPSTQFLAVPTTIKDKTRSKLVITSYLSRMPGYYLINCYSFNFLITVLSLTLFAFEKKTSRLGSTFKLILTCVSFKMVSNRFLPTISYMTSLDRYQIVNIIYLVACCIWHSTASSLNVKEDTIRFIDRAVFFLFVAALVLIQIVFCFSFVRAYRKIIDLKKRETKYLAELPYNGDDYDSEEDYYIS